MHEARPAPGCDWLSHTARAWITRAGPLLWPMQNRHVKVGSADSGLESGPHLRAARCHLILAGAGAHRSPEDTRRLCRFPSPALDEKLVDDDSGRVSEVAAQRSAVAVKLRFRDNPGTDRPRADR